MDWLDLLAVQGTLKSLLQHTVQKHQFFLDLYKMRDLLDGGGGGGGGGVENSKPAFSHG